MIGLVNRRITQFLRSPRVVLLEIVAIGVTCVLGSVIPQESLSDAAGILDLGPDLPWLVSAFGLDRIFSCPLFIGILALSVASLVVTLRDQARTLIRKWHRVPERRAFSEPPHRAEWIRRRKQSENDSAPPLTITAKRRIGLAGPFVLHLGLLVVVAGASLSAVFAVDGVVDMFEFETLAPTHEGWSRQRPGPLARPLAFGVPVALEAVRWARYPTGRLQSLNVELVVGHEGNRRRERVGVNSDLRLPGGRLFLSDEFGIAALVAWVNDASEIRKEAALLEETGKSGRYEKTLEVDHGARVHLRSEVSPDGTRPVTLEIRATRDGGLLCSGELRAGEAIQLPGEGRIELHALPYWVRIRGSRDPGRWVTYAGFALVLMGAVLLFTVINVHTCVEVTPHGGKETVFVALRAQRFDPLFEKQFQRLVRKEGGAI